VRAVVLDPLDFIARLCALIPPPRFHMLRYTLMRAQLREHGTPTEEAAAHLRLAELALRRARVEEADAHLQACVGQREHMGSDAFGYEFLRALVDLRLPEPRPVQLAALAQVRARHPTLEPLLPTWLSQLGVDARESRALGLERPVSP
jgi:hypothetical protein